MVDSSKKGIRARDRAYYRRRQQNRIFAAIAALFAEEAARGNITKKELAEILEKDPAQITRWMSEPRNYEIDTISDILLAMGAEMDHPVVRFVDRPKANFAHPALAPYLQGDEIQRAFSRTSVALKPTVTSESAATDEPSIVAGSPVAKEEIGQIKSEVATADA